LSGENVDQETSTSFGVVDSEGAGGEVIGGVDGTFSQPAAFASPA